MTILLPTRPGRVPLRDALGRHWLMRIAPLALFHLAALTIMSVRPEARIDDEILASLKFDA